MKSQNRVVILFAGAIIQLCIGIIYIWSIFQKPVMEYYNWSANDASLTFSIMLATFVAGILAGGFLNDKKGPRPVVFLGGALFVAGIFLSSLVPQNMPYLIYVFYGGIAGFGVGAAYTCTISCAQKWWADKRGFATGVIVCTFGASTVVFTPIANYLLGDGGFGVSATFRTLALIFLVIILIFGWFIKNPTPEYMASLQVKLPEFSKQKQYTPIEMIKTKQYFFLLLCMMFITPAYFIINPLLKTMGAMRDLPEAAVLAGVMITGVASACGRLTAPWLSDKIGRKQVLLMLYIITIACVLLMIFARSYLFIVLIALIAYAFGGSAGVFPTFVSDYFGAKNIGANYGFIMFGFAISGLLFPAVSKLVSVEGIPSALSFIIPAAACVVGIILTLALKPPQQRLQVQSTK